jgi:AraC-like DNA-binding protein
MPNTRGRRYRSNAVDVDATMSTDFETGGPGATRITASTLDDFSGLCCGRPHSHLLTDPESLSLHVRAGGIGPLTTADFVVDAEVALDSGDGCGSYGVTLVRSGHAAIDYRDLTLVSGPGDANVYGPDGNITNRWTPNSRIIAARIHPCAIDDALSAARGQRVGSPVEFQPAIPAGPALAGWTRMLLLLTDQLARPDSLMTLPLVGLPFVDSLVRGLLVAADHRYRDAVAAEPMPVLPRSIRAAVDIIEAEAEQPLTVTALATRSHISVRTLHDGFRRHLGMTPMAYVHQVRLHRAHRMLQQSDPSMATVTSIAHRWGFTNVGRFAAAHTARYGETPVATLRGAGHVSSIRLAPVREGRPD